MTTKRAVELLEIEKECVQRANTCGRDCAHCKLVQNDEELIKMYEFVIGFIKSKTMTDRERMMLVIVNEILHSGLSIDTEADQDYVWEVIRERIEEELF